MRPLRSGVVGVGRLGYHHARILEELSESTLTGVHDVDGGRGRAVAERLGTRHHASVEELLEACEAVVVAVPTVHHHEVARAALGAGCHVLVEKPLAATVAEADDLIAAAEEAGRILGVGHVERFNAAVRACEPHLRTPRFIESLRLAPFQPRGTDVTVILDLMIHDIDLVLGLVDRPIAAVHAVGVPVLSGSVDIANARLVFEGGAVADITASRVSMERQRRLRIFQVDGYFSLDLGAGSGEYLRRRPEFGSGPRVEGKREGGPDDGAEAPRSLAELVERVRLRGDAAEPLALELRAFLRATRGERSRFVSAREGRAALELALRITRQIEESSDVPHEDP